MRRFAVVIICLVIIAVSLIGCADNEWSYTNRWESDGIIIVSQDGEEFYFGLHDYNISGFNKGKKLGVLSSEYLAYTSTLYAFDGDDSENYMAVFNDVNAYDKYFPGGLDGHSSCDIYIRSGEQWEYDYKDWRVSCVAFIPYDDIPEQGDFDYKKYVNNHGIFDEEAKVVMGEILNSALDYNAYDDASESQNVIASNLGRLVYYLDGVDWFCFDAEVRYHSVYGYYISFYGWYGSDNYLLSENNAKALGVNH